MREQWIECGACALLALVCLAVAGWTLITGQVGGQGVDGLFLLLVALLLAAAFSIIPLQAVREGMLRELIRSRKKKAPTPAGNEPEPQRELAQNT